MESIITVGNRLGKIAFHHFSCLTFAEVRGIYLIFKQPISEMFSMFDVVEHFPDTFIIHPDYFCRHTYNILRFCLFICCVFVPGQFVKLLMSPTGQHVRIKQTLIPAGKKFKKPRRKVSLCLSASTGAV